MLALYLWPLRNSSLTTASSHTRSYAEAKTVFTEKHRQEVANRDIKPECQSKLYDHGEKTAKAVLLLHGYTACPSQFDSLAQTFFALGYNVYVPLAPHHGQYEAGAHSKVTASELVQYTDDAVASTDGLGNNAGAIGLSGGAVLATWAAEYRNDVIKRLLVLSPFYQPNTKQAAVWQLKPFTVLYGFGILPDRFTKSNKDGFSYRALAQYMRIVENYKQDSALSQLNLQSVAIVASRQDPEIDFTKAKAIPTRLAKQSRAPLRAYIPPNEWQLGHDIVSPDSDDIKGRSAELYQKYIELYRN